MGNICRSPTAHGVMQHKVDSRGLNHLIEIDSAGTHAYHVGEQSDERSRAFAASNGVDMEYIRARKISVGDYHEFDYILAMDTENLTLIEHHAPPNHRADFTLFLDFARRDGSVSRSTVPDPYYGSDSGFEQVFDLVDRGCESLLKHILNE